MLTLIDKDGPYKLPTGWHEVSTRQFCELHTLKIAPTAEAKASYFAGRPIQVNVAVADVMAFLLYEPPTEGGSSYPKDLGQETYLQVESIRAALAARPLHECFLEVYGLVQGRSGFINGGQFSQSTAYRHELFGWKYPITDTYPAVHHCLTELQRLAIKYAELAEPDPTEAGRRAKDAGADELLGMFTHFNVAKTLAEREGCSVDVIRQMPFNEVMRLYTERAASC